MSTGQRYTAIIAARLTIKENDSSLGVDGSRQRDSSLLSTTERDPLFSNLGLVSILKQGQVSGETTRMDNLAVPGFVVRFTENDIVLDGL